MLRLICHRRQNSCRLSQIRLAEVDHEMEAQQLGAAAGDIAVAAEVAVDLPGECIGADGHDRQVRLAKLAENAALASNAQLSAITALRNRPERISIDAVEEPLAVEACAASGPAAAGAIGR